MKMQTQAKTNDVLNGRDTLAVCELEPLLNKLRFLAGPCRCAARMDLNKACAILSSDPPTAASAYAEVVLRALPQAIAQRPVFYAPGTPQRSFDEAWLVRLLDRAMARDNDSFAFLIARRAQPAKRAALASLVRGLAARIKDL